MPLPKVVIVGRPNVGKSSIFNWLAGRRISIVDPMAGVTRDRVSTLVALGDEGNPRFIELFDTGGIGMVDRDDLAPYVDRQIDAALQEADLILFVVDIRDELMPLDLDTAARLRYLKTPVILVMNKADVPAFDDQGSVFSKLGRGRPIPVSTHQNRNKRELCRLIEEMLPEPSDEEKGESEMKIAVVGRPNTGKSTFINTLARAERMIVSERPGTTRDSVDVHFELDGIPFTAIDTCGVKRSAKIRDNLDFYSDHRTKRSIRRADVCMLFLDPGQGITRLDKQLADEIAQEHKPCIFVVNKWDLMVGEGDEPSEGAMGRFAYLIQYSFRTMSYMPIAFITARTGKNVKALINLARMLHKQAQKRVGTGALNRVVREAVESHPPPVRDNRTPRVHYGTQVDVAPPTIVLFVNSTKLFDATYQRYLLNTFREKLPFKDIPIKLYLRSRRTADSGGGGERGEHDSDHGGESLEISSRVDTPEAVRALTHDSAEVDRRYLNLEINELLSDSDS